MADESLLAARARELLHYDPATGVFIRKVRLAQRHHAGDRADFLVTGKSQIAGYYRVAIDSKRYLAHRLAWLYVYGTWPTRQIDHIDGTRWNNAITNLRDVSDRVNKENTRRPRQGNRSGYLGVYFSQNRWYARVQSRGIGVYCEAFDTPQKAHEAYLIAKRKLHEGCTI